VLKSILLFCGNQRFFVQHVGYIDIPKRRSRPILDTPAEAAFFWALDDSVTSSDGAKLAGISLQLETPTLVYDFTGWGHYYYIYIN
jgi:hypothetical protein